MREMTQIRDAVIRSLQTAGLQAMASFPAANPASPDWLPWPHSSWAYRMSIS